jgi:hypothetical protein
VLQREFSLGIPSATGHARIMRLVFVYNANAGLLAGVMDSLHKTLSPSTYPCDLCAITYGATRMKGAWRDWLARLELPTQFFHRPDFKATWPGVTEALPAIFLEQNERLSVLVAAAEFIGVKQVDELIALLESKLAASGLDTRRVRSA